jgi:hypothetical protein
LLIQKILDFKSWVVGCLKDGFETLARHTNMHIFKKIVDSLGWLVVQYKVSPTDPVWSLVDAPPIRLWKANPNGSPKLPMGVPNFVLYCPIWGINPLRFVKKQKIISVKLFKHMDFWKESIVQSVIYEMKLKPYVEYWEDILLHLSKPLPHQNATFLEGFWPSSNWRSNYSKVLLSTTIVGADPKDPIQHPYVG